MDKKLLESVTKLDKFNKPKVAEEPEEVDTVEEKPKPRTSRATTTRKRTSSVKSRMRNRTPRRKIDSDIIGGIDFD